MWVLACEMQVFGISFYKQVNISISINYEDYYGNFEDEELFYDHNLKTSFKHYETTQPNYIILSIC